MTAETTNCDVCEVGRVTVSADPYGTAAIAICAGCNGGEEVYGPVFYPPWHDEVDEVEWVESVVRADVEARSGSWEDFGIHRLYCQRCGESGTPNDWDAEDVEGETSFRHRCARRGIARLFDVAIGLALGTLSR